MIKMILQIELDYITCFKNIEHCLTHISGFDYIEKGKKIKVNLFNKYIKESGIEFILIAEGERYPITFNFNQMIEEEREFLTEQKIIKEPNENKQNNQINFNAQQIKRVKKNIKRTIIASIILTTFLMAQIMKISMTGGPASKL